MSKRRRKVLPGGRIKRWKASATSKGWGGVPPRWYRSQLNRRERRRARIAIRLGTAEADIDVLIVLDRVDSSWEEIKRTSRLRQDLSLEYEVSLNTLWTSGREWREGGAPVLEGIRREGWAPRGWQNRS